MRVVVSENGELTIPNRFRKQLRIEPGDVLDVVPEDDALVVRPLRPFPEPNLGMSVDEYVDSLRDPAN